MPTVISAPISDKLARQTLDFVAIVRQADSPRDHRKAGIGLINELTMAGLNGFFLDSSREIGLGAVAQGVVRIGLSTAGQGVSVVVRRFVGKFDDEQMRTTADILERIITIN